MRALALIGLIAALAFTAAGCGSAGSRSSAPAPTTGQPAGVSRQQFARLRQCMENHGAKAPSGAPPSGQQGQPPTLDQKTLAAIQACRQYLPAQPPGGFAG
jgi:hypothetical protein